MLSFLNSIHPGCVSEYRFYKPRKWAFDYAWPAHKLALEVEGIGGRHQFTGGFIKDMIKYTAAGILGWRVLRVTNQQIKNGQAWAIVEDAFRGDVYSSADVFRLKDK